MFEIAINTADDQGANETSLLHPSPSYSRSAKTPVEKALGVVKSEIFILTAILVFSVQVGLEIECTHQRPANHCCDFKRRPDLSSLYDLGEFRTFKRLSYSDTKKIRNAIKRQNFPLKPD